jgi:hypothetical protein
MGQLRSEGNAVGMEGGRGPWKARQQSQVELTGAPQWVSTNVFDNRWRIP